MTRAEIWFPAMLVNFAGGGQPSRHQRRMRLLISCNHAAWSTTPAMSGVDEVAPRGTSRRSRLPGILRVWSDRDMDATIPNTEFDMPSSYSIRLGDAFGVSCGSRQSRARLNAREPGATFPTPTRPAGLASQRLENSSSPFGRNAITLSARMIQRQNQREGEFATATGIFWAV